MIGAILGAGATLLSSIIGTRGQQQAARRQDAANQAEIDRQEQIRQENLFQQAQQAEAAQPFIEQLRNMDFGALREASQAGAEMGRQAQAYGVSQGETIAGLGRSVQSQLQEFAEQAQQSDTSGLAFQARRQAAQAGSAVDAALAARGIYTSGAGVRQQRETQADIFGNLAQQLNQDQLARLGLAADLTRFGGDIAMRGATTGAEVGLRGQQLGLEGQDMLTRGLTNIGQMRSRNIANAASTIASLPGYGMIGMKDPSVPKPKPEAAEGTAGSAASGSVDAQAARKERKERAKKRREKLMERARKRREKLQAEKASKRRQAEEGSDDGVGGFQGGGPSRNLPSGSRNLTTMPVAGSMRSMTQ